MVSNVTASLVTLDPGAKRKEHSLADIPLLRKALGETRTIAMVGLSDKPYRPSYFAGKYMLEHGYQVIPVNPMCDEILGQPCFSSLSEIPHTVDMVDCFRRAEQMPELATQAVDIGARYLWMQLSVVSSEAENIAKSAGLEVIMDRCVKIEHARLFGGLGWAGVNTKIISAKRPKHISN